jgi:hypothetical protein
MKAPVLFREALSALNSEQEFDPKAIAAHRLVIFPDGRKALRPFKPYWLQLRWAYMLKQAVYMDPEKIFKPKAFSGLWSSQDLQDLIPSDSVYRKAQEIFVRTLRDMVEKWRTSNWNLAACFKTNPEMEDRVIKLLRHEPLRFLASSSGPSLLINPFAPQGLFGIHHIPRGKDKPTLRARRDALTLFIRLVQHPDHTRLGKCLRCEAYFFGRLGQKCCPRPRRCGSQRAAIEATKRRWHRERAEKLEAARVACAEWESLKRRTPWNGWVAKRANVTQKWLTRAINRGDLKPLKMPTKSRAANPVGENL